LVLLFAHVGKEVVGMAMQMPTRWKANDTASIYVAMALKTILSSRASKGNLTSYFNGHC
jgi:hypothetical protein